MASENACVRKRVRKYWRPGVRKDALASVSQHTKNSALAHGPGKLGADARVRQRWEYIQIQRRGARTHSQHFVILALPSLSDRPRARIGYAVGRKVGGAVKRNRIKRLIREVFRRQALSLPPVDFVVIPKKGAGALASLGLEPMALELAPAFRQAASRAKGARSS